MHLFDNFSTKYWRYISYTTYYKKKSHKFTSSAVKAMHFSRKVKVGYFQNVYFFILLLIKKVIIDVVVHYKLCFLYSISAEIFHKIIPFIQNLVCSKFKMHFSKNYWKLNLHYSKNCTWLTSFERELCCGRLDFSP